jgi:hypothetical protein
MVLTQRRLAKIVDGVPEEDAPGSEQVRVWFADVTVEVVAGSHKYTLVT